MAPYVLPAPQSESPCPVQGYLDAVAVWRIEVVIHEACELDEIQQAHADVEQNRANGKLVVRVRYKRGAVVGAYHPADRA